MVIKDLLSEIATLKWRLKQSERDRDDVSVWEAQLKAEGLEAYDD